MPGTTSGFQRAGHALTWRDRATTLDRNEPQTGQPRPRPAERSEAAGTDQPVGTSAGQPPVRPIPPANPGGWDGPVATPDPASYPGQGQPGWYPPEHAPFARPPYGPPVGLPNGQPNADPRWAGGAHPGYPPQGAYPPPGYGAPPPNGQPPYQQNPPWPRQHQPGQVPPGQYPPGQVPPGQFPPGYGAGNQPPGGRPPEPGFGFSAGPPVAPALTRRKKGSIVPALIFGLLAVILGGVAVYLYVQERNPENPIAPTALPAENLFINVETALEDAGLTADTSAALRSAASYSLFPRREPGQAISIDGHDAWMYIFTGPNSVEDQQAATAAFRAEDAPPPVVTASRAPLTTGPPMLFSSSNVVILLSMDDNPGDDIKAKIQEAIDSLP